MKNKIAQYLLFATLAMIAASYLPWLYLTKVYYILRYFIMACTAGAVILSFSIEKFFSERFMRLFLLAIILTLLVFIGFRVVGRHYLLADLSQLIVAFVCIGVGIGLDLDLRQWGNVAYYYTLAIVAVTIANCFYWAGGLYIPEHYMLDEGKNQIGGMVAICGAAMFFFGIKNKEERTHFMVMFALTFLLLLLIRARADFFALLACVLFIAAKDCKWRWNWGVKSILTVIGICLVGYIIYVGFISDELHTFMAGGKSSGDFDVISSNRLERNQQGLDILLHDPLNGDVDNDSNILLIHNYILLRLVRYGIWSFPMVAFYLYFGIVTIIALFRNRKTALADVGYVVCMVPLLVSFMEPSFPYGPGSVQLLAFLLLGATFRQHLIPPKRDEDIHPDTVLHISNDFANSKVHAELYRQLDSQGVKQLVYSPIRKKELEGQNRFEGQNTQFIYSYILKPLHRVFFNLKIDRIGRDISKKVDLSQISCVHATNLFSDGAVALYLKRHYGIPYIVAVRNTDLNAFLKCMPHLWWVHRAVIQEADEVIFISPALQRRLSNHWTLIGMQDLLRGKSKLISNGVNAYWLDHIQTKPAPSETLHNILYVGIFDDNKNVLRLMQAVMQLKDDLPDIHLDLVGGDGNREQNVLTLVQQHPDSFRYLGKIYEKPELQKVYADNSVFAMPSLHETFGLVYVEALTQGLALLYTHNEGIDGLFQSNVGLGVNPRSTDEIAHALKQLLQNRNHYSNNEIDFSVFNWTNIAQTYRKIYKKISN